MKTPSVYVPGPARYPRILAYHEISPRFQLGITGTTPNRFKSHLNYLQDSGLKFVPLRGLAEQSPENSVCLTFDDGYDSFYDQVLPLLVERRIPATLFIISGYVGRANDWDVTFGINRRRHLSWEQIRQIYSAGIEIGSHTLSHRDLTRWTAQDVDRELIESKKTLEDKLGKAVTSLALPFGAVTLNISTKARQAGYVEICAGVPGLRGPLPGILPRLPVYRWDGESALKWKLDLNLLELMRLGFLHNFSRGTRWLKSGKMP
jgi:peptidoglycan/xylan/chitin deacetylase (PgdA/CDA1 family)